MKKILSIVLIFILMFGVVACGDGVNQPSGNHPDDEAVKPIEPDSQERDPVVPDAEDKPSDVIFETSLKNGQEVDSELLSFTLKINGENSNPNITVSALGAEIQKQEDSSYTAKLQSGDNVIIISAEFEGKTHTQEYKITYKKSGAPSVKTSLKEGLYQSDRFGFFVQAYDFQQNQIAPSFQWLKGTPGGVPSKVNGNIQVGFWSEGEFIEQSGDAAEVCEQYTDGSAAESLAYVVWADADTENVYYKVNMPDAKPNMNGWFDVCCTDAVGNEYTVLIKAEYKFSDDPNLEVGTVTFSVEIFTLGGGYVIEPIQVPYRASDNNATLLLRMLSQNGYKADYTGTAESSFYFSVLYNGDCASGKGELSEGVDPARLNISTMPDFSTELIAKMVEKGDISSVEDLYENFNYDVIEDETGAEYLAGLGEFDFYFTSGWMYSVNGEFPGVGASATVPNEGDVIRWQFSLFGYGMDLGGGMTEESQLFPPCDKTALTQKIAQINTEHKQSEYGQIYKDAIAILQRMGTKQSEVDEILRELTK